MKSFQTIQIPDQVHCFDKLNSLIKSDSQNKIELQASQESIQRFDTLDSHPIDSVSSTPFND